jgi:hypothetical protein
MSFMARRSLDSHGGFLRAQLTSALAVLDLGYGPRTITCNIASAVSPGCVVGLDLPEAILRQPRPEDAELVGHPLGRACTPAVSLAQLASGANRSTMLPSGSRTVA